MIDDKEVLIQTLKDENYSIMVIEDEERKSLCKQSSQKIAILIGNGIYKDYLNDIFKSYTEIRIFTDA